MWNLKDSNLQKQRVEWWLLESVWSDEMKSGWGFGEGVQSYSQIGVKFLCSVAQPSEQMATVN